MARVLTYLHGKIFDQCTARSGGRPSIWSKNIVCLIGSLPEGKWTYFQGWVVMQKLTKHKKMVLQKISLILDAWTETDHILQSILSPQLQISFIGLHIHCALRVCRIKVRFRCSEYVLYEIPGLPNFVQIIFWSPVETCGHLVIFDSRYILKSNRWKWDSNQCHFWWDT